MIIMYMCRILFCCFLLMPVAVFAQTHPATDSAENKHFERVEVEASFPGGDNAWRKYLMKNLDPNVPVDNNAPSGKYTVIVQFIVSKDGSLSSLEPKTNFGYGMEREVLRIIGRSGLWISARQNGRVVNAYRRQPVTFIISQTNDCEIITEDPYILFTNANNEITVKARKVKTDNLEVKISQGTITPVGDGKFNIKLDTTDRVVIRVYNKKNNKELAAASYEVKAKK